MAEYALLLSNSLTSLTATGGTFMAKYETETYVVLGAVFVALVYVALIRRN